ncbi:long-chain fatty acid--CoA ligase [uncultured Desulfosarcina sp.]|uniref:AMP-dependent synthetase/ligase n=1 Tax=uncultured Desulfosarcina sp. TaxID=218289 RepID=UPI0029C848CB|nr:long-chain fatty acid--CoA ligase [uncultured Desulfosarcina sp.]
MVTLDKPDNLVEMFEESVARFGSNLWMGTKNKTRDSYNWVTYDQVAQRIANLRGGLAHLGIQKGDAVGIIANNRVAWAAACYATYSLAGRYVPMYEAELEKTWRYIIEDAAVRVLFVSKPEILAKVKGWPDEIETLDHVVLIDGEGEGSMAALERLGRDNPVTAVYPAADDIAGLIYTSGTTGAPKGVLLSHGNLTSNVHASTKAYPQLDENLRTLSFLPWAHSYGQTAELHLLMRLGGSTGFAESPQTIVDDLALVKPTFLVAVPRVFNRVYDGLNAKMNEQGGLAKKLFDMGVNAGIERRRLKKEGRNSVVNNLKLKIADAVVFKKIREKFGGRLMYSLSSSAALSPHIAEFFEDVGIPVYEAWGMTELSPAGTVNSPQHNRLGSAGRPIDKVRLVIDKTFDSDNPEEGELIVYGPNVMKGYHNKPEETRATMTEDGGLRTGDRAYIDDDGYLHITGRIKEQFKLENGKFVSPATLEEEIKLLPCVEHTMIYGLNRPFTVCLVFPDFIVMDKLAIQNGWPTEPAAMIAHPAVKSTIENQILSHLKGKFGTYEIPKKFIILSEGFSIENGMLTQTFKLKRREVLKVYEPMIAEAYRKN